MIREFVQLTTCEDGNCPGFSRWTHTGDFRVQGYRVAQADKPAELVALDAVRDLVWSRSWSLAEHLARKPV